MGRVESCAGWPDRPPRRGRQAALHAVGSLHGILLPRHQRWEPERTVVLLHALVTLPCTTCDLRTAAAGSCRAPATHEHPPAV